MPRGLKLIEDTSKGMYRLQYSKGVYSKDYYNKTWAKEHLRRIKEHESTDMWWEGFQ